MCYGNFVGVMIMDWFIDGLDGLGEYVDILICWYIIGFKMDFCYLFIVLGDEVEQDFC